MTTLQVSDQGRSITIPDEIFKPIQDKFIAGTISAAEALSSIEKSYRQSLGLDVPGASDWENSNKYENLSGEQQMAVHALGQSKDNPVTKQALTAALKNVSFSDAGLEGKTGNQKTATGAMTLYDKSGKNINLSKGDQYDPNTWSTTKPAVVAPATSTTPSLMPSLTGNNSSGAPAKNSVNVSGLPTANLGPGSSGADVKKLQDWLVANGYMTQAEVNTGYGTYGPKTTAAVQTLQKELGVDNSSGPGYFGPKTLSAAQGLAGGSFGANSGGVAGNGNGANAGGIATLPTTGNPELDRIQEEINRLASSITSSGFKIPDGLQITPELTQQFLEWAHQAVDPQTQQLIDSKRADINASLANMAKQFDLSKGQTIQDFGTNLATEQNTSGGNGIAFSGLRNLTERNMANSTNRTIESLASNTEANIGNTLRSGAADLGVNSNFNTPGLSSGAVSIDGGSRGSSGSGRSLDFNYNPSLYKVGNIPTQGYTNVNNLAGNYLGQYTTLAGANSSRSMSDLIGGITGLPSGYKITRNLL